jgi:hypothetical protein
MAIRIASGVAGRSNMERTAGVQRRDRSLSRSRVSRGKSTPVTPMMEPSGSCTGRDRVAMVREVLASTMMLQMPRPTALAAVYHSRRLGS